MSLLCIARAGGQSKTSERSSLIVSLYRDNNVRMFFLLLMDEVNETIFFHHNQFFFFFFFFYLSCSIEANNTKQQLL